MATEKEEKMMMKKDDRPEIKQPKRGDNWVYTEELTADDILLGRGDLAVRYEGNIRFRLLVAEYHPVYSTAGRNQQKGEIAQSIVQIIRTRGGRFLRKVNETSEEAKKLNIPRGGTEIWIPVDEATVLRKVKQAFRDASDSANRNNNNNNTATTTAAAAAAAFISNISDRSSSAANYTNSSSSSSPPAAIARLGNNSCGTSAATAARLFASSRGNNNDSQQQQQQQTINFEYVLEAERQQLQRSALQAQLLGNNGVGATLRGIGQQATALGGVGGANSTLSHAASSLNNNVGNNNSALRSATTALPVVVSNMTSDELLRELQASEAERQALLRRENLLVEAFLQQRQREMNDSQLSTVLLLQRHQSNIQLQQSRIENGTNSNIELLRQMISNTTTQQPQLHHHQENNNNNNAAVLQAALQLPSSSSPQGSSNRLLQGLQDIRRYNSVTGLSGATTTFASTTNEAAPSTDNSISRHNKRESPISTTKKFDTVKRFKDS